MRIAQCTAIKSWLGIVARWSYCRFNRTCAMQRFCENEGRREGARGWRWQVSQTGMQVHTHTHTHTHDYVHWASTAYEDRSIFRPEHAMSRTAIMQSAKDEAIVSQFKSLHSRFWIGVSNRQRKIVAYRQPNSGISQHCSKACLSKAFMGALAHTSSFKDTRASLPVSERQAF